MGKYIDADGFEKHLRSFIQQDLAITDKLCIELENYLSGINKAKQLLRDYPAADVQEVRHARWIKSDRSEYYNWECSLCNGLVEFRSDFCPECGAKMEKWTGRWV